MTFYDERKWCTRCKASVPFLSTIGHSYCTECGREVTAFFSPTERRALASAARAARDPIDGPMRQRR